MGDLDQTQAAFPVTVSGSNSDGSEIAPVGSTTFDEKHGLNAYIINPIDISRGINDGGVQGSISVGTSVVEAKVGVNRFTGRKVLTVTPTNGIIYWGYTNSVTTLTGTPIFTNQMATFDIEDNVPIWLIAPSSGRDVRITEGG